MQRKTFIENTTETKNHRESSLCHTDMGSLNANSYSNIIVQQIPKEEFDQLKDIDPFLVRHINQSEAVYAI